MSEVKKKISGLARASGYLGICALFLPILINGFAFYCQNTGFSTFAYVVQMLLGVAAVVLGVVALVKISKNKSALRGYTRVTVGIVLGSILSFSACSILFSRFSTFPRKSTQVNGMERARGAEAKTILGYIRSNAATHYLNYGCLDGSCTVGGGGVTAPVFDDVEAGIGRGSNDLPSVCRPSYYFSYKMVVTDPSSFIATATRCTSGGKEPQGKAPFILMLTTNFAQKVDTWSGTVEYTGEH